MGFVQEEKFTDVVIPLIRANKKDDGIVEYVELYGTGFIIGKWFCYYMCSCHRSTARWSI